MNDVQGLSQTRGVVLLSTFRGERFVAEQLRSVLCQLPMTGRILVRDDGSDDATVSEIEALRDDRISVDAGANIGFGQSFLTLLSQVDPAVELVLFSDQDDVWLPGKIERAWAALQGMGATPALYGSAQMLVDEKLRTLHATPPWPRPPSFDGALTENVMTGCTVALNNAALRLLQQAGAARGVVFHDWWAYLVVSAFGSVIYDDQPTLLYRQHGNNLIGHGAGWFGRQRQIVRFISRNDWVGILLGQLGALRRHYGEHLPPERRRLIDDYFGPDAGGNLQPRWRLVFSARRWRQAWAGELALRLLLAAYKLRLWPPSARRLSWRSAP